MVLFELLQLVGFFLDYLRIAYLWHVLIMPLTNRNGITVALYDAEIRIAAEKAVESVKGDPRHHNGVLLMLGWHVSRLFHQVGRILWSIAASDARVCSSPP